MKVYGGIYYNENGLSTSIRGMHMQTEIMGTINNNINGFNKVGYQREESVISSFAEHIGVHGLSTIKDEGVGRISRTNNPLDFALGKVGYFQVLTPNGVKLSRDGRFKIDKQGQLLTLEDAKVLNSSGEPITLNIIPEQVEDIKVSKDGLIQVFDRNEQKLRKSGQLSVVSSTGDILEDIDVKQGFVESSNVSMHTEFFNVIPTRRNFEANRQLYIIQNDELSKTIQQLASN